MDRRLLEAAQTGNVDRLLKLIEGDPLMLNAVALRGGETPLHIASMDGHLDFVKKVLALRQEFAKELNQDGCSPLDLASANGHFEIVNELLKVDSNLCLVEGRDRWIPLHYAAVKGKVNVMESLLSGSVDSVEKVTAGGEAALHLAVKNNQFGAFRLLVEHLKKFNKEHVLINKDDRGNTILHLAVSRKKREVVDFILSERNSKSITMVGVNSLNERGLTPLDVLLLFQSEAGDLEIQNILQENGALRAADTVSAPRQSKSCAEAFFEFFRFKKKRDISNEVRNGLLTVAVLMATATYQAGLSPPAGLYQKDKSPIDKNNNITTSQSLNGTNITTTSSWSPNYDSTPQSHKAGESIMGSKDEPNFISFMVFNSLGFYMSLYIIFRITAGWPFWVELLFASYGLYATYYAAMLTIAPNDDVQNAFIVISGFVALVPVVHMVVEYVPMVARRCMKTLKCRDASGNTNQESA